MFPFVASQAIALKQGRHGTVRAGDPQHQSEATGADCPEEPLAAPFQRAHELPMAQG